MNPIKSATRLAEKTRTKDFYSPAAKFGLIDGSFLSMTRSPSQFAKFTKAAEVKLPEAYYQDLMVFGEAYTQDGEHIPMEEVVED